MKKTTFYILPFLFSVLIISCNTPAKNKKAIQECFDKYRKAIHENNGLEAVKYIDSHTIAYYDNILKLAKTSDSVTVSKMKFWDKTSVMVTRHLFKKEDILNMNGENLFILLVANEMFSDDEKYTKTVVQNIEIDGLHAKGEILINEVGKTTIKFQKVNNEWKFDLTSMLPAIEQTFDKLLKDINTSVTEDEFLMFVLKEFDSKEPSKDIWKPIL